MAARNKNATRPQLTKDTSWGHGWSGPPAFLGALANPPWTAPSTWHHYTGMLPQNTIIREASSVILGTLFFTKNNLE